MFTAFNSWTNYFTTVLYYYFYSYINLFHFIHFILDSNKEMMYIGKKYLIKTGSYFYENINNFI